MEITHEKVDETLIITIKGRLDIATAPVAGNAIKKILGKDYPRVLFNFNDLEYLSSGGLRLILGVAKQLRRKEGKLVLCSLRQFVKEIFVISSFDSLRFINCMFQGKVRKSGYDFGQFFINTTVGFADLANVAANSPKLQPSKEYLV